MNFSNDECSASSINGSWLIGPDVNDFVPAAALRDFTHKRRSRRSRCRLDFIIAPLSPIDRSVFLFAYFSQFNVKLHLNYPILLVLLLTSTFHPTSFMIVAT